MSSDLCQIRFYYFGPQKGTLCFSSLLEDLLTVALSLLDLPWDLIWRHLDASLGRCLFLSNRRGAHARLMQGFRLRQRVLRVTRLSGALDNLRTRRLRCLHDLLPCGHINRRSLLLQAHLLLPIVLLQIGFLNLFHDVNPVRFRLSLYLILPVLLQRTLYPLLRLSFV